jgi:hypothetical protein
MPVPAGARPALAIGLAAPPALVSDPGPASLKRTESAAVGRRTDRWPAGG